MRPADTDRVTLGGLGPEEEQEGKIKSPSGFLLPSLPSELENAFHVSTDTARTASSLTEGSAARWRRVDVLIWSVFFAPIIVLAALFIATWMSFIPAGCGGSSSLSRGGINTDAA